MTNYESKALEMISTEIGKTVFNSMKPFFVEAVELEFSNRWEDIFAAVLEANPVETKLARIEGAYRDLSVLYNNERDHNRALTLEVGKLRKLVQSLQGSPECTEEPVSAFDTAGDITVDTVVHAEPASIEEEEEGHVDEADTAFSMSIDLEEDALPESLTLIQSDVVISEEEDEDPFAHLDSEEEVVVDEDPFNKHSSLAPLDGFLDSDVPPVPEFEGNQELSMTPEPKTAPAPGIPMESPVTASAPLVSPLKKDETKMVTYQVFDKEVNFIQDNARINDVKNGSVRRMAMQLHNVMMQKNDRYKPTEEQKQMGKFYTQMIREWGLEIAAANNIETIKGDDGAAILIAELFYSLHDEKENLIHPALRFRNEEERKAAADSFYGLNNADTRPTYMALVDAHKGALALDPIYYVGAQTLNQTKTLQAGYALLHARMSLTWGNATGKTECVFAEVRETIVKKVR